MTRSMLKRREVLLGAAGFGLAGLGVNVFGACRPEGTEPPDRGKILADLVDIVIVPAYAAARGSVTALDGAVSALRDAPTAGSLSAARLAWKDARAAWKPTDAFLFGPADDLALTGGVIDTPSDIVKIEALVSSTTLLSASAIGRLGANQRGLPAVEALLFDPAKDDDAMLAAFTEEGRRGELAALVAADLRAKVELVVDAWTQAPTEYGTHLSRAGRGSSVYTSERQGVDAVVNALISAAEILIALRLAKPLGIDRTPSTPAPELIESPRSDASIDDLLRVLDGIEMVYFGRRGDAVGVPLSDAVAERSPSTDARMRSDLDKAKEAVRAIPGPLRTAVVERRDPVIAAHAAVREVKRCLATEVAGALGTSVGFNVTDGD